MAEISRIERIKLEKYLDMGEGFVLNFVNRTFEDFFLESFNIEIYNDKYNSGNSGSKANRLREFWKKESNYLVGKYIKTLTKKNIIESEMTIRILKFSISILDSFNYVRNNQSFAHDNESIINYSESILIIN